MPISWNWLSSTVSPLQSLIGFLQKQSKTNDVQKKQVIMELRDNLNLFREAYEKPITYDRLVDLLSNDAYRNAVKENFNFKKIKPGAYPPASYQGRQKFTVYRLDSGKTDG